MSLANLHQINTSKLELNLEPSKYQLCATNKFLPNIKWNTFVTNMLFHSLAVNNYYRDLAKLDCGLDQSQTVEKKKKKK